MIILVKLIAAHLIGDFMLQSDKMCSIKYGKNLPKKLFVLFLHSAIQAILSLMFIGEWSFFAPMLIIFASHFVIDFIKVQLHKKGLWALLIDQAAHYLVIFFVWHYCCEDQYACSMLSASFWIIATAYVAVLAPASILIKTFMDFEGWIPGADSATGLRNAGRWIGYMERVLILTFIFTQNVAAVGFLLAAKSVFRFGELNRNKDVKFTEYVLIGTFASFAVAILIGFAAQYALTFIYE